MVIAVGPEIALRSRSPVARGRYIQTAEQVSRSLSLENDPRAVLEACVAWLELFQISAMMWEYIQQQPIRSLEQLRARAGEVEQHVRSAFPGFDAVMQGILGLLPELRGADDPLLHGDWGQIDWAQLVRSFDAVVAECPIEGLELLGRRLDEPDLAHRARNAYDALRAFVRRHDPNCAEIKRIVGEQYRRGNLRLREAARLLGMSTSDAVFELEQDGYSRALSVIALAPPERDAVFERLRRRRLESPGAPTVDPDLVERDVIASERIESVDARAWIRRR